MAKDATPNRIRLVNDNFANDNHRHIAEILDDEWDASTTFTELGEEYDAHRATFQKVYNRYFAPAEEDFGDGIEEDRPIEDLKEEFGSYSEYRTARERGEIDKEPKPGVTEREMELIQEGYRRGYSDGFQDGLEQGQSSEQSSDRIEAN